MILTTICIAIVRSFSEKLHAMPDATFVSRPLPDILPTYKMLHSKTI
jgi:hypothetical protein